MYRSKSGDDSVAFNMSFHSGYLELTGLIFSLLFLLFLSLPPTLFSFFIFYWPNNWISETNCKTHASIKDVIEADKLLLGNPILADYYLSVKVASSVPHLESPITLKSFSALVKGNGEMR